MITTEYLRALVNDYVINCGTLDLLTNYEVKDGRVIFSYLCKEIPPTSNDPQFDDSPDDNEATYEFNVGDDLVLLHQNITDALNFINEFKIETI